jgi:exosortase/archaeosortase family protein
MFLDKKLKNWFIHFLTRLGILFGISAILYKILEFFNLLYPIQLFETGIIVAILKPFFPGMIVEGTTLSNLVVAGSYSSFSVVIDPICLGFFGIAGIVSLVMALPNINTRTKKKCLLVGIPLVFAANILRIISVLVVAAMWGLGSFDFVHAILFKADLAAFIIILFFVFIHYLIGKNEIISAVERTNIH